MGDGGRARGRSWTGRPGRRGKAEMREDLLHDDRIRNGGDQAQPAAAAGTRQHVQPEGTAFQLDGGTRKCRTCHNERQLARYHATECL